MLEQVDGGLGVVDGHLTGGKVLVLRLKLQRVVRSPLVQVLEVLLLVLDDLRAKDVLVVFLSIVLDTFESIRELRKDSSHQEFLRQRECLHVGVGNVQEFRLQILSKIEVTEVLVALHHVSQFVVLSVHPASRQIVCKSNCYLSNSDKVHFSDFFLLLIDEILLDISQELARLKTKRHFVKELAVFRRRHVLTLSFWDLAEEVPEVVEDIVEEVVDDDTSLDTTWHTLMELVVLYQFSSTVVFPVEFEMVVDLMVERVRQGVVVTEASKHSSPVVELEGHFINR